MSREKATSDPGSIGAPMSGVVVEVRVKEGQEIKKGDPVCVLSAMKVCSYHCLIWSRILMVLQMESAVTAPVSGHVKRVAVQEGTSHLDEYKILTNVHFSRGFHQPRRSYC